MLTWLCKKQFSPKRAARFPITTSLVTLYRYNLTLYTHDVCGFDFSQILSHWALLVWEEFRKRYRSVISDFNNPEISMSISVGHQIRRRILELPYRPSFMYILAFHRPALMPKRCSVDAHDCKQSKLFSFLEEQLADAAGNQLAVNRASK